MTRFASTRQLALTVLLALALACSAQAADYRIDPTHTTVLASWSHFGFSNPSANFAGATGVIRYDDKNPEHSSIEVSIPVDQLQSFVPELNAQLKGPLFFDAAKYPLATFKSTKVQQSNGRFKVTGNLTLHGITRPVTLKAKLNYLGMHEMLTRPAIGFEAEGVISRSAFGLDKYLPQVGDAVELRISTEAHAAQ